MTTPDEFSRYAKHVFDALGGALTAACIWLGDRLGLYRALAATADASSVELAARTALDERWVREWLHQQGAAGVLEHRGGGRFALPESGHMLLADEGAPACGIGFFAQLPQMMALLEQLPEAFRTGCGLPYDALGPEGAANLERGSAPWFRACLVPVVLPLVRGAGEMLGAGGLVADVGCGAGVGLLEVARAFPASECHGWDVSARALERADANRRAAGLSNLHFHDARHERLPEDGRFALVMTIDCLHDMPDPAGAARAVRRALRPDGAWLIGEIKARDGGYEENVARNPMAALMYGMSVLTCMSSALSEPGGAGLGTLGLPPAALERLVHDAGLGRFERLAVEHPVNAFYVARP